jgi:diacylglycerol O-acyltransferase / wax synthase
VAPRLDRLSPLDLVSLWTDGTDWVQDVGLLAVLDGPRAEGGRGGIEDVRAVVATRLDRVPRLRQVLRTPRRGLGRPLWVDAPAFDLDDHVRVAPDAVSDEAGLLAAVEALRERPLDRSRPLWELWLLPGLPDGRVGLYLRAHHALVDAAAGVAIVGALLDPAQAPSSTRPPTREGGSAAGASNGPGRPAPESAAGMPSGGRTAEPRVPASASAAGMRTAPPWIPAPEPTAGQLLADQLLGCGEAVGRAVAAVRRWSRRPRRRVVGGGPDPRRPQSMSAAVLAMIRHPAPRTSLIRRVGPGRTVALVRDRLDRVKAIAHAHDATVNDVLLAAITGGLRGLSLARGEPVDGVVLRALVPVSMHHEPGLPRGNVLGQITAPLPVGVADPAVVLRHIAAATAEQKARVGPRRMPVLRSRALQRVFLAFMAHQRMTTLTVADVPGPRVRLSLGGMPVLEMFPLVPLIGNMALGVGALSYAGTFAIAAVADRAVCPDVDVFAEALRRTLDALAVQERADQTG